MGFSLPNPTSCISKGRREIASVREPGVPFEGRDVFLGQRNADFDGVSGAMLSHCPTRVVQIRGRANPRKRQGNHAATIALPAELRARYTLQAQDLARTRRAATLPQFLYNISAPDVSDTPVGPSREERVAHRV